MPNSATIVKHLLRWYRAEARDLPWRRAVGPYGVWISEIMLQQTQVKTVIPYWSRWMERFPNLSSLAVASESEVLKHWEGLGYYSRARNLHRAAKVIQADWKGRFPRSYEAMLSLPGIGRYTAGAIASIAFNQPRPIVDGNVTRVLTRLDGIRESVRERRVNEGLWTVAEELVRAAGRTRPAEDRACGDLNQSLMELGAMVCLPRAPHCMLCPVRRSCVARREGAVVAIPNLGPRRAVVVRSFVALVLVKGGRYLVSQRDKGGVNGGLWEFPNWETDREDSEGRDRLAREGLDWDQFQSLGTLKHSITHNRITLQVLGGSLRGSCCFRPKNSKWLRLDELENRAFTAVDRKILRRLVPKLDRSVWIDV